MPEPKPGLLPPLSRSSRLPGPSAFGPAPSLMTGAAKLMFGMFAGGWKFGGYPGLPCWLLSICCMPGAAPVPGAAMPGGAVKGVSTGQ